MKKSKKLIVLILAFALLISVFAMASCNGASGDKMKVGVAMPTQSLQRWNQDGAYLKEKLEEAGFEVDLQYADNKIDVQISQIENMITSGCEVLIIASVDGSSLGIVLEEATAEGIPVIAYDRLLMETPNVSYYATFDNYKVGTLQGEFIRDTLDLDNASGSFNIELFAGSPDDNNALFFYQGAYDVLHPYIESGKLNVVSGQQNFEDIAILEWSTETAQNRMDDLLTAHFATGTPLHAVLSPNDSIAIGVANALDNGGYVPGQDWPIITGQDCDIPNVKNIIEGKQSMSILKDTRVLADRTVAMVVAISEDKEVPTNDTGTYNNGTKDVPTYICELEFADANNYEAVLIDSGYYPEDAFE